MFHFFVNLFCAQNFEQPSVFTTQTRVLFPIYPNEAFVQSTDQFINQPTYYSESSNNNNNVWYPLFQPTYSQVFVCKTCNTPITNNIKMLIVSNQHISQVFVCKTCNTPITNNIKMITVSNQYVSPQIFVLAPGEYNSEVLETQERNKQPRLPKKEIDIQSIFDDFFKIQTKYPDGARFFYPKGRLISRSDHSYWSQYNDLQKKWYQLLSKIFHEIFFELKKKLKALKILKKGEKKTLVGKKLKLIESVFHAFKDIRPNAVTKKKDFVGKIYQNTICQQKASDILSKIPLIDIIQSLEEDIVKHLNEPLSQDLKFLIYELLNEVFTLLSNFKNFLKSVNVMKYFFSKKTN